MTANPSSLYHTQYLGAVKLFDEERFNECVQEAEHNLINPTLSRYWHIKNLIRIAEVTNEWRVSSKDAYCTPATKISCACGRCGVSSFRICLRIWVKLTVRRYKGLRNYLKADEVWHEAKGLTSNSETRALEVLQELRENLDELRADLEAEMPEDVEEALVKEGDSNEDSCFDETRATVTLEDTEAVHRAEMELFGSEDRIAMSYEMAAALGRASREEREAYQRETKGLVRQEEQKWAEWRAKLDVRLKAEEEDSEQQQAGENPETQSAEAESTKKQENPPLDPEAAAVPPEKGGKKGRAA